MAGKKKKTLRSHLKGQNAIITECVKLLTGLLLKAAIYVLNLYRFKKLLIWDRKQFDIRKKSQSFKNTLGIQRSYFFMRRSLFNNTVSGSWECTSKTANNANKENVAETFAAFSCTATEGMDDAEGSCTVRFQHTKREDFTFLSQCTPSRTFKAPGSETFITAIFCTQSFQVADFFLFAGMFPYNNCTRAINDSKNNFRIKKTKVCSYRIGMPPFLFWWDLM